MSTTRKKIKVLTTGADYGVKAAGATTVGLNALIFCGVAISNPIILAIAGVVCSIFCCIGGYNEWRQPEKGDEIEDKLDKIEEKVDEVIEEQPYRPRARTKLDKATVTQEMKRTAVTSQTGSSIYSIFSRKDVYQREIDRLAPDDFNMDVKESPSQHVMR